MSVLRDFDAGPTLQQVTGEGTLDQQFEDFNLANPWVYDRLAEMTRTLVARGRTKVGIGMLFEVLRWEHAISTNDPHSEFKLNNNYRSRYARLLMVRNQEWKGLFETRRLHT